MTRMDNQIQLKGAACEIHRNTGSSEDAYGDVIPTWAKQADEYVWLERMQDEILQLEAGVYDANPYKLRLQSTTVAQKFDKVVVGSESYIIQTLRAIPMRTGTSHVEGIGKMI